MICVAKMAAFFAPAEPSDMAATGTPPGIWSVDRMASSPESGLLGIGTPITGSVVCAAQTPASEVLCARKRLQLLRQLFVYDWTGASFDAFSALLVEICGKLAGVPRALDHQVA